MKNKYNGSSAELTDHTDNLLTIDRSYFVDNNNTTEFNREDYVIVNLNVSFDPYAPEGYYEITDVMPSGLRFMYLKSTCSSLCCGGSSEGQLVNIGFYKKKSTRSASIQYIARIRQPGEYTADHAAIKYSAGEIYGFSEKSQIRIR